MDLMARRRKMMIPKKANDSYLTFTALQANSTVAIQALNSAPQLSLEYSLDGGNSWSSFTVGTTEITLTNVGDNVKFRGVNTRTATSVQNYNKFIISSGRVSISGDITSIINGIGGVLPGVEYMFFELFYGCSRLMGELVIPITSAPNRSLYYTFYGCNISKIEIQCQSVGAYALAGIVGNCGNLNEIKLLLTSKESTSLKGWMRDSTSTHSGILICDQSLILESGDSGLPTTWTRMNLDGTPYVEP